jgi:hypothetical protein
LGSAAEHLELQYRFFVIARHLSDDSGEITGNAISFSDMSGGNKVLWEGVVSGDEIHLTAATNEGTRRFTATKASSNSSQKQPEKK